MQLCLSTAFFCFSVVIDSKTNTILYPPFATEALITSCTSNLTTCLNTTSTIWKSTMIETMMGPTSTTWNYTRRDVQTRVGSLRRAHRSYLLRRLGRPRWRRRLQRDGLSARSVLQPLQRLDHGVQDCSVTSVTG